MAVNKQNQKFSGRLKLLMAKWHIRLAMMIVASAMAIFPFVVISSSSNSTEVIPPEGTYDGEDVKQPIEFPHNIHVKVNKINCMYCHTYARRSKVAGIPPTSKCMGCHKVIAT
ncbi:MAG: cytochrome c3 family protein, partial [Gammaproteobacteria bacterium]